MSGVVVVADQADSAFILQLHRLLGAFFSTALIRKKSVYMPPHAAEIILADAESVVCMEAAAPLIVYNGLGKTGPVNDSFKNAVAIVNSANPQLLAAVSSTGLPVITCGLSPKDSVTLSSIDNDQIVVSVQRAILCTNGSIAEPQEIPFTLSAPIDHFAFMALTAILILLGQAHRLLEGKNIQKRAQELTE